MFKNVPPYSSLINGKYWLSNVTQRSQLLAHVTKSPGLRQIIYVFAYVREHLQELCVLQHLDCLFITSYFYHLHNFVPTIMHLCMICPACIQIAYWWDDK